MSFPTSRVAQPPPWTNSLALGGDFVYLSQTDEIAFKDGSRYARPKHVPAKSLENARYEGHLPFVYSSTPPADGGNYLLENGRSRALSAPESHGGRPPTGKAEFNDQILIRNYQGTSPSGSPAASYLIDSVMGTEMQSSGSKGGHAKPTQPTFTTGKLPAVPQPQRYDQINLRQPVRPGKSVRAFSTGSEQKPLPLLLKPTRDQVQRDTSSNSLQTAIQTVKRNDVTSTTQTRSDTERDRGQKGPVRLPRSPQDINVHFATSSAGQGQQGNPSPGSGHSMRVVPIGNRGLLKAMFPDFAARKRGSGDVGRIILVLCREPAGGSSVAPTWTQGITLSQAGGRVFARVERYVIIDPGPDDESYCVALPIKTYGGRGVSLPGMIKSHHCIIYSSPQPPAPMERERPVRGEDGMRRPPIRVVLDDPTRLADHLDPTSRVHLMGAIAIEDEDLTRNFGRVSRQFERDLVDHFWTLWTRRRPLPRPPSPEPEEESDDDGAEEEEDDEDEDDEESSDGSEDGNEGQQQA